MTRLLERDPEKWKPVFRKDHAQLKILTERQGQRDPGAARIVLDEETEAISTKKIRCLRRRCHLGGHITQGRLNPLKI
jgi:hypothetical protein